MMNREAEALIDEFMMNAREIEGEDGSIVISRVGRDWIDRAFAVGLAFSAGRCVTRPVPQETSEHIAGNHS